MKVHGVVSPLSSMIVQALSVVTTVVGPWSTVWLFGSGGGLRSRDVGAAEQAAGSSAATHCAATAVSSEAE